MERSARSSQPHRARPLLTIQQPSPAYHASPIPHQSPAQHSPYVMAGISSGYAQSTQIPRPLKPFERVPVELWLRVFGLLAKVWIPTQRCIGWVRVTHACRHWRNIALKSPCLWTDISLYRGRACADTMIERSLNLPLAVEILIADEIKMSAQSRDLLYNILRGHLPRIKTLVLRIDPSSMARVFDVLTASAPTLKTLSLTRNNATSDVGRLPELDLGRSRFPQLQQLMMVCCPVSWQSSAFHRLEVLHLRIPGFTPDYPSPGDPPHNSAPSLMHVLDALDKASSTLYDLKLELGYIPPPILDRIRGRPGPGLVQLSSLQHLSIDAETYVLSRVLTHMRFPSATTLTLTSFTDHARDNEPALSAPGSFDDLLPAVRNAIQFSSIYGKAPDEIRISGFEDDFAFEVGWSKRRRFALRVVLEHKNTQAPVPYWLKWMYKLFSFKTDFKILRIQIDREMSQGEISIWNSVLTCPGLESLQRIGFGGPNPSADLRYISGQPVLPHISY